MLTVDLDRHVDPGDRILDVGCGEGRHTHACALKQVDVVGLDKDTARLQVAKKQFTSEIAATARTTPKFLCGDASDLPFPNSEFDIVICAEVLEHLPDYHSAIAELHRVLAPGGTLAVSVPRAGPERICWMLSDEYHAVDGGHVRIFDPNELQTAVESFGLDCVGREYAHAFHAPYWWLMCFWWERAQRDDPPFLLGMYERFLEWAEFGDQPILEWIENGLDRFVGKSTVLYFENHEQ